MGRQWKQCQTIFLGSKITEDGDWSHEIKRCLLLGRKVMISLGGNGNPLQYSCLENPRKRAVALPSMGLHRVRHDWHDLAAAADSILKSRDKNKNKKVKNKKQRHYFANKDPSSQGYGFSSSYVWTWELDCKESWALKNWCFWTVVLEKTLESPLDCNDIQPVHPKGNQS